MKFYYLTILSILILNFCHAQEPLYPYKAGRLFGYSTKEKKMVIPPVYIMTEANNNFYICHSQTGMVRVFNSKAEPIDSASYGIYQQNTGKVLLIDAYNLREMVTLLIAQQQQDRNTRQSEWIELTPSRVRTIDSAGNIAIISDTIGAIHEGHYLLRIKNGGKQGIYDTKKGSFIVPMSTDSIWFIPRKYIVTTGNAQYIAYSMDGSKYNVPSAAIDLSDVYDNGRYFETKNGKKRSLYDKAGKLVFDGDKNWERLIYRNNKTKAFKIVGNTPSIRPKNVIRLYNAEGTFLKNASRVEDWMGDLLLVTIADSVQDGASATYLYNVVKNTWQPINATAVPAAQTPGTAYDAPAAAADHYQQFLIIKHSDYTAYINGYTGKLLFNLPDSVWKQKSPKQVMGALTFTRFVDGTRTDVRYNFVRENVNKPLTLFDPQLNVINRNYDSITSLRILHDKFAKVKKKDKYGLINGQMEEIIPAKYDALEFKNNLYAKVTKKGKTYWIDTADNVVFGGAYFDYISDYSVNGKWLAFTYQPPPAHWRNNKYDYTEVAKAHIINANGEILATWNTGNTVGGGYILTVNERILRYPNSSFVTPCSIQLYDPKTNKVDSCPTPTATIKHSITQPLLLYARIQIKNRQHSQRSIFHPYCPSVNTKNIRA